MNMEGVAALIYRYMRARGLSHKQLAMIAGMTESTLSRRLADPGAFRAAELHKIFRALGVPEEERVI
jgi:transcriptional regulator with XRE-family HTH domain